MDEIHSQNGFECQFQDCRVRGGCNVGPTRAQAPTEKKITPFYLKEKLMNF